MIGFMTIAVGQTAGAPLFGFLPDEMATGLAVTAFAAIALASYQGCRHWPENAGPVTAAAHPAIPDGGRSALWRTGRAG